MALSYSTPRQNVDPRDADLIDRITGQINRTMAPSRSRSTAPLAQKIPPAPPAEVRIRHCFLRDKVNQYDQGIAELNRQIAQWATTYDYANQATVSLAIRSFHLGVDAGREISHVADSFLPGSYEHAVVEDLGNITMTLIRAGIIATNQAFAENTLRDLEDTRARLQHAEEWR